MKKLIEEYHRGSRLRQVLSKGPNLDLINMEMKSIQREIHFQIAELIRMNRHA
jgi:hypothetical protein